MTTREALGVDAGHQPQPPDKRPVYLRASKGEPRWVRRWRWQNLPEHTPPYVRNCITNPDRHTTNIGYTWLRGSPDLKTRFGVKCGSWRCPECQTHASRRLYTRLLEGLGDVQAKDCAFMVLTLDGALHARDFASVQQLYRELGKRWQRFRYRLNRWLVSEGLPPLKRSGELRKRSRGERPDWPGFCWTLEQHKSGVPHMNVFIYHPALAARLRHDRKLNEVVGRMMGDELRYMQGDVKRHAIECGFGPQSMLEALEEDALERVCSYIAKVAKKGGAVLGELAKQSQLPHMAPKGIRRYSASHGLLAPMRKNPERTGCLLQRQRTREGDERIVPLVIPKDPLAAAEVWRCVDYEERRLLRRYGEGHRPGKQDDDWTVTVEHFERGPP